MLLDPKSPSEEFHDFIECRRILKVMAGHKVFKKDGRMTLANKLYLTWIYLLFFFLLGMSVTALFLTSDDKTVFFHSFHVFLLMLVGVISLSIRVANDGNLTAAMESIKRGVYVYAGETVFPEHSALKKLRVKGVLQISKFFSNFILGGAVSNVFLLPVMQYLSAEGDSSHKPLNPYLPQPFYLPFDTRTLSGYAVGFIINVVFMGYLCAVVVCVDESYTSLLIQTKAQLEILNHSMANIRKRALDMLLRTEGSGRPAALCDSRGYQECLYTCLRSNIQHHQEIKRLEKHFKEYSGPMFLLVLLLASVILAALILLILENPGFFIIINFTASLSVEMLFTFHFCWYGEELAEESGKVMESAYRTPWPEGDKRFRVLVEAMLVNTRRPITIKTAGFNIPASLETFGNIITSVYQIMNIVRGKK